MKLTEKKLSTRNIVLITVALPVLVIIISSIAIIMTAKSVQPQSTLDTVLPAKTEHALPASNEEALIALDGVINYCVEAGTLRYEKNTAISIDSITCKNTAVEELLSFAKSSFTSKMSEKFESVTVKYGEDASALLGILPGSAPDSFTAEYVGDNLNATLIYEKAFRNMFFTPEDTAAIKLFIKENEAVFSSINEKLVPGTVKYIFSADEMSGAISSLKIVRSYTYSSHISFKNTLSAIGSGDFEAVFTFEDSYSFSFAGIEIAEDIMTLSENGYDTLSIIPYVEANLSEDEYSLTFYSSDESVAAIDENGQVTAIKEHSSPVTVSVRLNYLGQNFSDSCLIYVVTPVEKVTVSDTALSLKAGEKHTLSAKVGPDDATIKTVKFISDNEAIVKVTDSGEITAVAPGTATVYAYSEQGLICSGCLVTVTE